MYCIVKSDYFSGTLPCRLSRKYRADEKLFPAPNENSGLCHCPPLRPCRLLLFFIFYFVDYATMPRRCCQMLSVERLTLFVFCPIQNWPEKMIKNSFGWRYKKKIRTYILCTKRLKGIPCAKTTYRLSAVCGVVRRWWWWWW